LLRNAEAGDEEDIDFLLLCRLVLREPIGRDEPMVVPIFEFPSDARIRDTVIATHIVLRQHGETYSPNYFVFASYDMPNHRGPTWTSEVWIYPAPNATAAKAKGE